MTKPKAIKAGLHCLLLITITFLCTAGMNQVMAQPTIHYAVTTDVVTCPDPGYLNSAVIDYTPNCGNPTCAATNRQLSVISRDLGLGTSTLTIDDKVNTPICFTFTGYTPDVALGNNNSGSPSDYKLGVVYALTYPLGCGSQYDIWLDVYDISGVGVLGSLSVTLSNSYPITSHYETSSLYPHIDIIAQYSNTTWTGSGGLPLCDQVAICWTDTNQYLPLACGVLPNSNYGVNACYESLKSPVSLPLFVAYPTGTLPNDEPRIADIAGVERFGVANSFDGYVTYTDNHNDLYEIGINLSSLLFGSPVYLAADMDSFPRIDAIDNYNNNDYSSFGTNNVWMVVDNNQLTAPDVYGYYGYTATHSSVSIGGWTPSTPGDFYPVVTYGTTGQVYTAAYYHADPTGNYMSTNFPNTGTLSTPTDYYIVNYTGIGSPTELFETISSTCNNDGSFTGNFELLAAWNTSTKVYEKQALDLTFWKHGHNTAVNNLPANNDWTIAPNPATDHLLLTMPDGIEKGMYSISDITGRELLAANMNNTSEQVDISRLKAGMYMLRLYEDLKGTGGNEVKVLKFVKE